MTHVSRVRACVNECSCAQQLRGKWASIASSRCTPTWMADWGFAPPLMMTVMVRLMAAACLPACLPARMSVTGPLRAGVVPPQPPDCMRYDPADTGCEEAITSSVIEDLLDVESRHGKLALLLCVAAGAVVAVASARACLRK